MNYELGEALELYVYKTYIETSCPRFPSNFPKNQRVTGKHNVQISK